MNPSIEQMHLDILSLCLKLKSKGHDAFYTYSAHVGWANVNIYINGWGEDKEYDKRFDFLWASDKDCADDESKNIVLGELNECRDYLQALLDGE